MSADFMIYTDDLDEFDGSDFESWCKALGYEVELHPDFSIRDEGFLPIRFRADFLGAGSWLTGFELFSGENTAMDMTAVPYEPPVKKQGFLAKLFGKSPSRCRSRRSTRLLRNLRCYRLLSRRRGRKNGSFAAAVTLPSPWQSLRHTFSPHTLLRNSMPSPTIPRRENGSPSRRRSRRSWSTSAGR